LSKLYLYKLTIILFLNIIFIFFSSEINNFDAYFNFSSFKSNKNPIKIAFYCLRFKYGGIGRLISKLLNYLSQIRYFKFYLITVSSILEGEYSMPNNTKRISLYNGKKKLFEVLEKERLDIIIYNFYNIKEMEELNKLNSTKVIYFDHSSYFFWIYRHIYSFYNSIYNVYKNGKYIISLVPLENDFLFKKWGIKSVLIDNIPSYDYNLIKPSNLSHKNIIMIGRGKDPFKRFNLGIMAMKKIIKEIPESRMNIISSSYKNLRKIIKNLNLENHVKITGFQINPDKYLKNSSLHIFTSLSEAYPMVLGEVKIFGIPSILCGLDYIALSHGGTVIIYDDNPDIIAKESIKILKNDSYRKKLGKEARISMKKYKNKYIIKKWIKLLLAVYNGINESSYINLFTEHNKRITQKEAYIILNNQLNLIKKRIPKLSKLTLEKLESYSLV